ncbi:hypothetical protein [Streptomyces sp. BV286]|uniref:hypothetical protein n=1 Tax=unclassified Streptomyces TaxID=2593676 RepID=UPI001C2EEC31|nr:hypothetical protein [Streptomyces sp. BV286]MBV1936204.1 hypothetical protein [Streptomyces sp. BV286]
MSDQKKDTEFTTQDNGMPTPPAKGPVVKPLDNGMPTPPQDTEVAPLDNGMPSPSEPAKNELRTMDNGMPAPPALDLDGGK